METRNDVYHEWLVLKRVTRSKKSNKTRHCCELGGAVLTSTCLYDIYLALFSLLICAVFT